MAEFDHDKFRELVLYVAWRTRNDPRFGRVKLAKTLFYADFQAYAEDGKALTSATYEHWQFGPFPPVLYNVQDELVAAGIARLREGEFEGDTKKLIVDEEPVTPHIEAWQKEFIDMKIAELAPQTAKQVSDESHNHPGWALTQEGDVIPYAAALIPTQPPAHIMRLAARRSGLAT